MSWNARNSGTTEAELTEFAERAVRSALPPTWEVDGDRNAELPGQGRHDLVLTITAPDGTQTFLVAEVKGVAVPRDVARIADQLNAVPDGNVGGAMLIAPFVSPTTRAQLERHGLGWLDLTGNFRLRMDRPAVFVDRTGADRSGFRDPADRLLKSLRGPAAAKVVLELSETALPVGVRELAGRARVGPATSARVLDLLDREAVILRGADGTVTEVRKRSLVSRWADDYKVMKSNDVITTIDPRGLSHALAQLSEPYLAAVVTGSAAARAYLPDEVTPVSPLVSLSLYAENPVDLMDRLGLRKVDRGTNVLVMQPYDHVVHARARLVKGLSCAAPAQVLADLLTGPGRAAEEANQLMDVLASTDPGWTS